jgi:hypothetical protein
VALLCLAPGRAASFGILLFSHLVCWTVCEYQTRADMFFFSAFSFRRSCAQVFGVCFSRPADSVFLLEFVPFKNLSLKKDTNYFQFVFHKMLEPKGCAFIE